jgi:hypothetical protein|tara:strand:- start:237 stop:458 length:222 start_codon:yes stop_codon:yes gene_type:complete
MNLNAVKTLWPLLALIAMLGGFYYTTELRLNHLEADVAELREDVGSVGQENAAIQRSLKKLQRKVGSKNPGKR